MTTAETTTHQPTLVAKRPANRRTPWPAWVEAIIADWRKQWPEVFTKPVPLAVGITGQIKAATRANDRTYDRKAFGMSIHIWTMQNSYLRALARGEMRRNLDGSGAGIPDEAARQAAQKLLDERAERQAEKERQKKETAAAVQPS
jgi:sRNA-binding protein